MRIFKILLWSLPLCVGGVVFFLVQMGVIFIHFPGFSAVMGTSTQDEKTHHFNKDVAVYFWRQGTAHTAQKKIIWPNEPSQAIRKMAETWLSVLVEEKIVNDDVKLLSVALTQQGTIALVAFNKTFLPEQASTHDRWQLVESFLRTLRVAGVVLEGVHFLQGQEPLQDDYLDFSDRWPIGGYQYL